ncbi:hypothetical protein [Burkholderia multivorans]|uniref:hypothetical protein n=1 Tax=Burkholderia multivorans TaxID=87883 RepID=UPI0021C04774|nr:hypothetical protein [Burkholderia multivorans]
MDGMRHRVGVRRGMEVDVSRWTTTEVQALVREVPRARTPEALRPFFPRHSLGGIRWKASRLTLPFPPARGRKA